ncbi:MAG TPA: SRPBCC family protein [Candidatus Acidoferrum sp.]|jgi:activator of HSP90 ATPase
MIAGSIPADSHSALTRRQIIGRLGAAALAALAVSRKLSALPQQQDTKQAPTAAANQTRTSLHQEIELKASPQRIYETLLDSKQFAAFTGMPANIDAAVGGAFSMFGGMIVGRNVEVVPAQRIVQAWRPTHWDPGVYSVVKFELKPQGSGTLLILDHTGFPEGEYDSLFKGWGSHYWDPLKKHLG